jgi:hypothetical protein
MNELRASLQQQLAEETERRRLRPEGRIAWLGERLEEYVDRWLGFVAITRDPMPLAVDHVLFSIIEIGAEAAEAEMRSIEPAPAIREAWRAFEAELERVQRSTKRDDAERLKPALAEWQRRVTSERSQTDRSGG